LHLACWPYRLLGKKPLGVAYINLMLHMFWYLLVFR